MNGKIYQINPRRGMVAVLADNGTFSVFELLGDADVALNDPVFWQNDTNLGSEILHNRRSGLKFEVYFQNHWIAKQNLHHQLLL